jgi:hypothetical protein
MRARPASRMPVRAALRWPHPTASAYRPACLPVLLAQACMGLCWVHMYALHDAVEGASLPVRACLPVRARPPARGADMGQSGHFDLVFGAAKKAGWLVEGSGGPRVSHVGFGLVLGEDGKRFRWGRGAQGAQGAGGGRGGSGGGAGSAAQPA